jgi:hypothetical protein
MSFLNWPIEQSAPDWNRWRHRKYMAMDLLRHFQRAFPEVAYQLLWISPTINAQAWISGAAKNVTIYGGLVRHPDLTRSGLALSIAHETGHHLGGSPRDPEVRWMTWQGQADYWAARTGMPRVFGERARNMTYRGARQIANLQRELSHLMDGDEPDISAQCRNRIFLAGVSRVEIPDCAKIEYRQCFNRDYPEMPS